jgi:tetrapyrrole methylase family protein/MazG family protein
MVNFVQKDRYTYEDLVEIIRILRSPEGCPWDKVQTHASIRRGFLEEAYEAVEAIDLNDPAMLCEELGDVMMQVVFHASLEEDAGRFNMDDVADGVVKKLLYRHPHVFGSESLPNPEAVLDRWDVLKRAEKGQRSTSDAIDAVARSLPGLWRSEKMQSKAAKAGLDREDTRQALTHLAARTDTLQQAVETQDAAGVEEALGDVLFAAVKVGQREGIDPESAIHRACERYLAQFRQVEGAAAGCRLSPEELDALWEKAKQS